LSSDVQVTEQPNARTSARPLLNGAFLFAQREARKDGLIDCDCEDSPRTKLTGGLSLEETAAAGTRTTAVPYAPAGEKGEGPDSVAQRRRIRF
jgi:hypothetical protein